MDKIRLNKLKPGAKGKIVNIALKGASGRRLMDLGFIPGSNFTVVRNAPLVDPVELEIRDNNVSIRHDEAKFIEVIVSE
ncbi:MAG: FeoA family protein [Bacillota bacterium]